MSPSALPQPKNVCVVDILVAGVQDSDLKKGVGVTDPVYATFGRRVRTRREELHMTQADLSTRIGLSRASVANIEGGRQAVLLHQFLALAEALSLPPMSLLPAGEPANNQLDLPEEVMKFMQTYKQRTRAERQSGP